MVKEIDWEQLTLWLTFFTGDRKLRWYKSGNLTFFTQFRIGSRRQVFAVDLYQTNACPWLTDRATFFGYRT
jgi:hypothetical protein